MESGRAHGSAYRDLKTVMIDATYLRAHRTASSLRVNQMGGLGRLIGRTKGGMNTKLHAASHANGRPLSFFMTAGQVSDYTGAAALLDEMPKAQWLLGDRGHDADWFRDALQAKGTSPASQVGGTATSLSDTKKTAIQTPQPHRDNVRPPQGLARVATRYNPCPTVFLSAIAPAAAIISCCDQKVLSLGV